jgi:hypothetical protein
MRLPPRWGITHPLFIVTFLIGWVSLRSIEGNVVWWVRYNDVNLTNMEKSRFIFTIDKGAIPNGVKMKDYITKIKETKMVEYKASFTNLDPIQMFDLFNLNDNHYFKVIDLGQGIDNSLEFNSVGFMDIESGLFCDNRGLHNYFPIAPRKYKD